MALLVGVRGRAGSRGVNLESLGCIFVLLAYVCCWLSQSTRVFLVAFVFTRDLLLLRGRIFFGVVFMARPWCVAWGGASAALDISVSCMCHFLSKEMGGFASAQIS